MGINRFSFLDRPLAESLGLEELLGSPEVSDDDVGLRFYLEVLGLEHLHYGLWDDSDPLTLEGLKSAQKRYLELLISLIPDGVERVLDVGCGAGGNARVLQANGYAVEGLSPDESHGERFRAATDSTFHQCRFEDFAVNTRFDLVLMSESAQYVPLKRLFASVDRSLEPGGRLLLSDYFARVKDGSYIVKSGHLLSSFLAAAEASGFVLEHEQDITDRCAPTLDFGCQLIESYLLPSVRLAFLRGAQKRPRATRLAARFLRRRLSRSERKLQVLDSALFREKKRYMVYRFVKPGESGRRAAEA